MPATPELFWVHNERWETAAEIIARLKKLSPSSRTLHQLALEAGLSKVNRNPRWFSSLLKQNHITWVLEDIEAPVAVPYDFWRFEEADWQENARLALRKEIEAASKQIKAGKAKVYRGCWA